MHTILADENIPFAQEAFSTLGSVKLVNGRTLCADDVKHADMLIVRSVTRVDRSLLESSDAAFIGTCTIGTDHVDIEYLESRGIGFTGAPGCNANSVSEYICAVLLETAADRGFSLTGRVLGIVGAGNVGSKVEEKARTLGMDVILNDPPLRDKTGDRGYRPIDEIFDADIISMHVPLTAEGDYPTYHMADERFFKRMGEGRGFINSSRGSVTDSKALFEKLERGEFLFCACDVWENEPSIDPEIADQTDICTPHIAGYSFEGKVNGTYMIYSAACDYFNTDPEWRYEHVLGEKREYQVQLSGNFEENMLEAVRCNYSIRDDDLDLRQALQSEDIGSSFDSLRKNYRTRREFTHSVLACPGSAEQSHRDTLEQLGFEVVTQE